MAFDNALTHRLGLATPIIQAPMAGGGDTPAMVAAVSEAGGMGSIGAAYLSPAEIAEAAREVRRRTDRPFAINLFAPWPTPGPADAAPAIAALNPFFAELGLPFPEAPRPKPAPFANQLAAVLDSGASVFSFTFGIPPAEALEALRSKGMILMGTATTVDEAISLEAAGVDAVIAQGAEAGGHRGTFDEGAEGGLVGTIALVPQMVDAISIPIVASGGIMDGRGVAAALMLGAQAVQMGTAFMTCDEAGVPAAYRAALLAADEDQTGITRAFSGRRARGVVNRVMQTVPEETILPFPLQNALTRPMRTAAASQGRAEFLSLWAGQGLRMLRAEPAAELVARLTEETRAAIAKLGSP